MQKIWILIPALTAMTAFAAGPRGGKDNPCTGVFQACKKAGFKPGGHGKGNKGLKVDCMDKLVSGQKVDGVTIDANDPKLVACRTALSARAERKKGAAAAGLKGAAPVTPPAPAPTAVPVPAKPAK